MSQTLPHHEQSVSGSSAGHPVQLCRLKQYHLHDLHMVNNLQSSCSLYDSEFKPWFARAVLGMEGSFLLPWWISKWIFIQLPSTTYICQLTPCVRLWSWFCKFHEDPGDSWSATVNISEGFFFFLFLFLFPATPSVCQWNLERSLQMIQTCVTLNIDFSNIWALYKRTLQFN